MEELATVVGRKDDKVEVKITRNSACSKCDTKCALADESHERDEIVLEVKNNLNALESDRVILEMQERNLVFATLLIYLNPIILMIAGYFVGVWFGTRIGFISSEPAGIIGTFIFLIFSFLINKNLNSFWEQKTEFQPKIKKIVNS